MKNDILLKIAGKSILKNKMRTLLTMLGVIIGVGAVSVLAAVGTGAKRQIEEQIQNLGTNLIVITAGSTSQERWPSCSVRKNPVASNRRSFHPPHRPKAGGQACSGASSSW